MEEPEVDFANVVQTQTMTRRTLDEELRIPSDILNSRISVSPTFVCVENCSLSSLCERHNTNLVSRQQNSITTDSLHVSPSTLESTAEQLVKHATFKKFPRHLLLNCLPLLVLHHFCKWESISSQTR